MQLQYTLNSTLKTLIPKIYLQYYFLDLSIKAEDVYTCSRK